MQVPDIRKASINHIPAPFLENNNLRLDVLRLDKIHPVISGNKWFKLKYHLDNFNAGNYKGILTFGGMWSNHIVATACACYSQGIDCTGIIRGEKPLQLSTTLTEALKYKMRFKFVARADYKKRSDKVFITEIETEFPDHYIIPEGGAGPDGEKGASEILGLLPLNDYTHIVCAVGTGTTLKGIKIAAVPGQSILGVVVLKGWDKITAEGLFHDYHFGGYAKYDAELLKFMNYFFELSGIPTDFVYTGKLAYAICDLIDKNYFPHKSKILMIHSGGLQGNRSLQKGSLIF